MYVRLGNRECECVCGWEWRRVKRGVNACVCTVAKAIGGGMTEHTILGSLPLSVYF